MTTKGVSLIQKETLVNSDTRKLYYMSGEVFIPDVFEHSFLHRPLCIKTWDGKESKSGSVISVSESRHFFDMVAYFYDKNQCSRLTQDYICPNGETVGEFSICYSKTLYGKRKLKSSKKQVVETKTKENKAKKAKKGKTSKKRPRSEENGEDMALKPVTTVDFTNTNVDTNFEFTNLVPIMPMNKRVRYRAVGFKNLGQKNQK